MRTSGLLLLPTFILFALLVSPLTAREVFIARNGEAQMPIVVKANGTDETRAVAETLKTYLDRISGGVADVEMDGAHAFDDFLPIGFVVGP